MQKDLNVGAIQNIHFIGIGGIGMSALARFFLHEGKKVSGSDREESAITEALKDEGARIFSPQAADNISNDIELVVYTEAMSKDHEEMVAARALGVPMMNYFEALSLVANEYYLIAISGTHGKTTTTAMLTDILEEADLDPTAIIGSLRSKTGSNFRAGKSKYAIVEACEYRRDFLSLTPDILVITNIEAEHLDYYKDLADVQSAFTELASQVHADGIIVANLGDENTKRALYGVRTKIIDYSKYVDPLLELKQPGLHNQMNAAAALATSVQVGVPGDVAKAALQNFAGTWRRFEYKGEVNGAPVYDDYGHHPTEIKATLQGAHELYPNKKILLVYQPHLDSRTEKLFDDFVSALTAVDCLILTPAYVARDVGGSHDSTKALGEALIKKGVKIEYIEDLSTIPSHVKKIVSDEYVVLVMGAGNVTSVGTELVNH